MGSKNLFEMKALVDLNRELRLAFVEIFTGAVPSSNNLQVHIKK